MEGVPTVRLGIVGGGQLGRMMSLSAHSLGIRVACLEVGGSESPAGQVTTVIDGALSSPEGLRELASRSDVLTVEIEHVDVDALEAAATAAGIPVHPSPSTIRLIQNKYNQKVFFTEHNVPLGDYIDIASEAALTQAIAKFGLPLMLKSKCLAYDGRGNFVIRTLADAATGWNALNGSTGGGLFAEKWVPFVRELAVVVARDRVGAIVSYPVVHTVQRDSICHVVLAPAQGVSQGVLAESARVAAMAVSKLSGAGIFGVELFELSDGRVLLNEIAPRVHNSGHFSTEACTVSQFEQHVRAVCGLPLGDPQMRVPAAAMINVLGAGDGPSGEALTWRLCAAALGAPGASVHWYGKRGSMKRGRKVGHVTITGESGSEVLERTRALLKAGADPSSQLADADIALHGVTAAPIVGVIMGSDSDLPAMAPCAAILREFGIPFELTIVSAHRTPDRLVEYARSARVRGLRVIIAAAGGAAHLPGMVAALTALPVVGVPIPLKHLDGVDSLHSILQMPKGVPVATVAIGNAANGALLAARIIGVAQPTVLDKMEKYQERMRDEVLGKAEKLERLGADAYLAGAA